MWAEPLTLWDVFDVNRSLDDEMMKKKKKKTTQKRK